MKNYSNLLFDFDGTLFDTSLGIFNSMQHVCDYFNLPYGEEEFRKMIGPTLKESFSTIFHFSEKEIPKAIDVYREYYADKGMFECTPYPGVFELIKKLRSENKKILVATSKPEEYAKKILEQKGFYDLFDFVAGADIGEKIRYEKIDVLLYLLDEFKLKGKEEQCLMIGDRKYDVEGAHTAGIKCAGVLWGFGNRKEFEECNADYIFENPTDAWEKLRG